MARASANQSKGQWSVLQQQQSPLHRTTSDKLDALIASHAAPEVCVAIAVDVCRARAADGERLTHNRTAQ